MKKPNFLTKLKYHFDNQMSKGNIGMMKLLLVVTIGAVAILTFVVNIIGLVKGEEDSFFVTFWDMLATTINAWMPFSEDGTIWYVILNALAAIVGLFVTSILIGIISTAIEEKVDKLKKGHSIVVEENHIIVIGYELGETTLLRQLIIASNGEKRCILVASDLDREEIEKNIRANIVIPKNIKLICRSIDSGDYTSLVNLSLNTSKTIIINEKDDVDTIQYMLLVNKLLSSNEKKIKIISSILSDAMTFPPTVAKEMNIICIQTNTLISKIIAHSCTENGISKVYATLFDIRSNNIRSNNDYNVAGKKFGDLLINAKGAVPIGIRKEEQIILNPDEAYIIDTNDKVVYWCENEESLSFSSHTYNKLDDISMPLVRKEIEDTLIIGNSKSITDIIKDFPEETSNVFLGGVSEENKAIIKENCDYRNDIQISFVEDIDNHKVLKNVVKNIEHIIILPDDCDDSNYSDTMSILRYIKAKRDVEKYNLKTSITLELKNEKNLQLIKEREDDYIIAPHVTSMFLVQLSICGDNLEVYKELLKNEGCEVHIKSADLYLSVGEKVTFEARNIMKEYNMILLGYILDNKIHFLHNSDEVFEIKSNTRLIVISEK